MPDQPKQTAEQVVDDYRKRLERLLDTYWQSAVAGEHKSAELVRRLLQQHAALFGVGVSGTPAITTSVTKGEDELAKLRARRTGA